MTLLVPDGPQDAALLRWFDRCLMPLENSANFIAAGFVFVLMILGCAQIGMRTIFNNPMHGYIDLVELSMAGMAFLGAAYTQRMGAHIRMELLIGKLKGRPYWGAEILTTGLAMFVVATLIYYGWGHFMRSYELGDTTIDAHYPVWPSKIIVPFAFSFWFFRLGVQLAGSIRMFIDPSKDPVGVVTPLDVVNHAKEEAEEILGHDALNTNKGD